MCQGDRIFGRTYKQEAGWGQEAAKNFQRPLLSGRVAVNQQVSAKDEVVGALFNEKVVAEQIGLREPDVVANGQVQSKSFFDRAKMAGAECGVTAAKRVFPVDSGFGLGQGTGADIDGIDMKAVERDSGLAERHGRREGFFARGAG